MNHSKAPSLMIGNIPFENIIAGFLKTIRPSQKNRIRILNRLLTECKAEYKEILEEFDSLLRKKLLLEIKIKAYEYAISLEEVGSEKTNETIKDLRPMAETDSPELSKDEKDSSKHLGQDRSGERP